MYLILRNSRKNLYQFFHHQITEYWEENDSPPERQANFEDVLYSISVMVGAIPSLRFDGVIAPFFSVNRFPRLDYRKKIDVDTLREFAASLVDAILDSFRTFCRKTDWDAKRADFAVLLSQLRDEFDVAFITTNYDDLIWRTLNSIETGFDSGGIFKPERIFNRKEWPCLLHLHGSVHFNMPGDNYSNLHEIRWQNDLTAPFQQNAFGRNPIETTEGSQYPTSSIIAGYGKTEQIMRRPFRTYYSELDRLASESDAILSMGFSFLDAHVRQALLDYRDGRDRPVVVIDWAPDDQLTAASGDSMAKTTAARSMRMFARSSILMASPTGPAPVAVADAKRTKDFERFTSAGERLSIWYDGMHSACLLGSKVVTELTRP